MFHNFYIVFLCAFLFCFEVKSDEIKVMYAGFGRSGTASLHIALKKLGFNPLHGEDIVFGMHDTHAEVARAIGDRDVQALVEATEMMGYDGGGEMHGHFWREIYKLRPNAKYICIIRP